MLKRQRFLDKTDYVRAFLHNFQRVHCVIIIFSGTIVESFQTIVRIIGFRLFTFNNIIIFHLITLFTVN